MSSKSTQRIAVVISLCLIFVVIGIFFAIRQLNAQGGGAPGAGMMAPPAGVSMTPPGGGGKAGPSGMMMPPNMPGMSGGGGMMGMPGMPGMGGGSQSGTPAAESAPTGPMLTLSKVARGIQTKSVKNWDGRVTPMLRFKYKLASKQVLTVHLPKAVAAEKHTKEGWEAVFQSFSMDKEAIVDAEIKNNPTPQSNSRSGGATGGMIGGGMPGMPGMGGGMPGMIGGSGSIPMLPPMR
ncbi:MAG: hypothetical protein ACYC0V_14245 [Armatimonadota bacterium]